MSFLHRDLPTFQRGLQLSLSQRLAQIVIHPCRKTLFAFSLHGVSRQGDDVDRRLPRARWAQPLFPLTNGLGSVVSVHLGHLTIHENKIVRNALKGLQHLAAIGYGIGSAV